MDNKEIKLSESIQIVSEVSGRREFSETYHSETKSIGEFDFEYSTAGYCSSSYDDEVFINPEDIGALKGVQEILEPRKRRTSDVIDSMGDSPPKEKSFFPSDFLDPEGCSKFGSPPITPGSDMGYFSTCGPTTPPSLLKWDLRPVWSRFSSLSLDGPSTEDKKQGIRTPDQTDAKSVRGGSDNKTIQDELDAKPNRSPSYSIPSNPESKMPVHRDSSEYNMNHARRGYAHIFNHDTFLNGIMPDRKGSDIDVKALESTYRLLGFEVQIHDNLDISGIQTAIKKIMLEDYSDCDCLSISVLTHGKEPNLLYSYDYMYSADSLWQSFTADNCPTLAGKPKLFFIQACRGEKLDGGVRLVTNRNTETDSGSDSYKIPRMADFLIASSTVEGFYSWRNPENGTWFVQSLCRVLKEHHESYDLMKMMIIVSRLVAIEHESYNDIRIDQHEQKQVPSITTTLIRDVFFRPK